jgi:type I restriction enzyme S subunit
VTIPTYPSHKDSGVEWLGSIPTHWTIEPFYGSVKECDESNEGMTETNLLSLSYGRIVRKDITTNDGLLPESFDTYQIVRAGDIVLRLTDLQNDKRSLRSALVEETGIITAAYLAVRPRNQVSRFMSYLLRAYDLRKVFYSMGGGLRQAMKFDDLKRLPVLLPPKGEQSAIADFLDHETRKIDLLVAEQRQLLELLKEKRQAVISQAVAKGLNPSAPMKDSGIDWLAEIPAHWEIAGLTKYMTSVVDYRGRTPTKVDDGVFLVTARNIRDGKIDYSASEEFIDASEYEAVMRRGRPEIGDVLFTTEAPLGQVANVDRTEIALAQRVIKFRGRPSRLDNYFLKYWIMGSFCQADMIQLATGSTALGIKGSKVGQLRLCLPPLDEQNAIVRFLDARLADFDALTRDAECAVNLLLERRGTLICAAVTGQFDLRQVPAPTVSN